MIVEVGHFALALCLAVAIVQAVLPLVGAARGHAGLMRLAGHAACIQAALCLVAFAALTHAYLGSDFSVVNVVENSHSAKPLLYKITGVWGNHEGSLLLWLLILTLFGAAVALFGGNLPAQLRARVLAVQSMLGVGFLAFILFTSNPFTRTFPPPLDGQGLNPLLQDPGLAFHPPFLYLGYVGFSIAFAFAVAALIEGRVDAAWARWVRPWTLAAWTFLTIGIALGSWWAYYELGWGGWWFWDPVENASFMPWLAGTALVHSAVVVEKRDALKTWTVLLAILTFSLSLLGTFIVRSGVLNSVHAFATDPARGIFILGFLVLVVGGSLTLFAIRAPALRGGGSFRPVSREGGLVLNNLLLATATATVLVGTLYPLFLDAVTGEKVTVGPPYFNAVFVPLMVPLIAAMGIGPLLAWKRGDLAGALARLRLAIAVTVAAILLAIAMADTGAAGAALGLGLAAWLAAGTLTEWAERIRLFRAPPAESWRRAGHLPRAAWGMTVAHLGMAMLIAGITVSSTWSTEAQGLLARGGSLSAGPVAYRLDDVTEQRGANFDALSAEMTATWSDGSSDRLAPEQRRYTDPPMETTEAAIRPSLVADLYAVVGRPQEPGAARFAVRVYHKPMVSWIWLGSLVMALGGAISLTDRRHRVGAPAARRRGATDIGEQATA
ncbi:heme lyase CcmF/NrfE family subunit [Marinibaculum pumilum]|uniref:Heme lyase CcmF/NrfE family subunit n=1 Tax=Marinibaculum pumilum TaxID=1766165 RepID=A0ABV7KYA3_9PROT